MKGKHIAKRALSLALCAVMLVSCWVFAAPQAEAATSVTRYNQSITTGTTEPTLTNGQGQYRVRILVVEDGEHNKFMDGSNMDGTIHDNKTYKAGIKYVNSTTQSDSVAGRSISGSTDTGDYWCEWAQITYKNKNGTGSEGAVWFNLGDYDAGGRKDVISSGGQLCGYFPADNGLLINGFPTGVTCKYFENSNFSNSSFYFYLQVATWNATNNSWSWTGDVGGNGTQGTSGSSCDASHRCGIASNYTSNSRTSECWATSNGSKKVPVKSTGTILNAAYPKPTSTYTASSFAPAYSNSSTALSIPKATGSTDTRVISYTNPVDQYGVTMVHTIDVASSVTSNLVGSGGLSQSGATTSVNFNQNITTTTSQQTITATLKWPYINSSGTSTNLQRQCSIKAYDAQYTVTFKNGTKTAKTEDVYYGSNATAPTGQTKDADATNHYTFSSWDTAYTNVTADITTNAVFTPTAHNSATYWKYTTLGATYHKRYCKDCGYVFSSSLTHSIESGYHTDANQHWKECSADCGEIMQEKANHIWDYEDNNNGTNHKKYCETCNYIANATEAHSYTEEVVDDTYKKSDATCVDQAVYYKSCKCGAFVANDANTFSAGAVAGEHSIEKVEGTNNDKYYSDGTNHWRWCTVCEKTINDEGVADAKTAHDWDLEHGVIAEGDEATCVAKGHTTYTCKVCAATDRREDVEINANNHNWVLEEQKATDGVAGYKYYRCGRNCGKFCAAKVDNTSETHYAPNYDDAEDLKPNAAATESASVQIPAPTFNDSATDTIYNVVYASRLASIRIEPEKATQAVRFAGSVEVPSGISTAIGSESVTDNVVVDFGFVYTQTRFITLKDGTIRPDYMDFNGNAATGKPTAAKGSIGYQIYQMSVKRNNSGLAYNGSNGWSGVTQRTIGGKTYLTFNLVIEVGQDNWGREYSARPYITYKFNGTDYTVYDNGRVATDEDSTYYYNSVNDIAESIMYDNEDMEYYVGIETSYQNYVNRLIVLERDKRYCLEKIFAANVAAAGIDLNNVSQVDNFCWNNEWCTPNQIKAFRNYVTESIYLSGDASSFVYPE